MRGATALVGAVLLLAASAPAAAQPETVAQPAADIAFAPPLGRPLTYRVTTRKLSRSGKLIGFTLVYDLGWERLGRGYRLSATLARIESDARPELVKALTGLLDPLVGETLAYLVPADGSSVELVDPEALWARVTGDAAALGTAARQPEAQQVGQMLAALPPAERDRLASADIRALVAAANVIPEGSAIATGDGAGHRTVTRTERETLPGAAGGQVLRTVTAWTIDPATGLVLWQRRQGWLEGGEGAAALVEEHVRALDGAGES